MAVKVELFDVKDAEEKDDFKYDSREQTFSSFGVFQLRFGTLVCFSYRTWD